MPVLQATVNGRPIVLEVPEGRTLAEVLRYDLGLTGTKIGCGEGVCGACTVLVDGEPVRSCRFPALKAQGRQVLTIEGVAKDGVLHPLQEAFIRFGALQCGFCTPGMVMTALGLLLRIPNPTEEEILSALRHNLCRCTGYRSIVAAVRAAAGHEVAPYVPPTRPPGRVVGRPVPRTDAVAKVTGAAIYADDLSFPGMLYGAVLRAGVPHARIRGIDVSAARTLPGVHAVLTAAEIPGENRHGLLLKDWPVLCTEKVRYVGDAVALVAAETPEVARQALDLIRVDYEPLPVVADPLRALEMDAPRVHEEWPTGNLLEELHLERGDVERGFAEADVVIERTYRTPMVDHAFLEPECAVARRGEDGRIEVYVGSQIPHADREQVAAALGEDVRVLATMMGGGFGGKEDIAAQIHAALLAQATGRPVKVRFTRAESLLVHPKRHAMVLRVRLGARRDGRLVALEHHIVADTGAYASLGPKVLVRAVSHAGGPYEIPNVRIDGYLVYTNNPPAGAFRGFGVPQVAFALESALDELAAELGMDPIEVRRRNLLRVGSRTCTGQVLRESVGLEECLDRVETALREAGGGTIRWGWRENGRALGWGLALAYKNTGLGGGARDAATAEVELFPDGRAEVRVDSAEMGQGLPTVLAMVVAEELGIPVERVVVVPPDTDHRLDGGPTTASRQTFVSGNAVRLAAARLRGTLARVAGERLDVPPDLLEFRDGRVVGPGGVEVALAEAIRWAREEGHPTVARHRYEMPPTRPVGEGGDTYVAYSFAALAALVEVDETRRTVRVRRIIAAHDVGRAINPLALEGQIEGGIVMGLGTALKEQFVVEDGIPKTRRLAQCRLPTLSDVPEILSFLVEHPTSEGPYGAKGIGELPTIPVAPAIANGIYHAVGVRLRELPLRV
ncbi:MAG: molybdopterin-dependent oxidoreductase [Anaerolineae bacterium]|nr:molybdopterin-dependent oxidoreductase [Anaerolineae bacterium]